MQGGGEETATRRETQRRGACAVVIRDGLRPHQKTRGAKGVDSTLGTAEASAGSGEEDDDDGPPEEEGSGPFGKGFFGGREQSEAGPSE